MQPVAQSCYKVPFDARLRPVTRVRSPTLPRPPRARDRAPEDRVADPPMSESTSNALRIADPLAPVRHLDVVLLVLAALFVVLLGAPVLGYAVGAVVWLIGVGILAVGLAAERADGFTAALVCLAAYTVHLATTLILRPLERNPE